MTTYAKRKLKYSRNENFNLLHYVEWDRFVTLAGSKSGLRLTLSYLGSMISPNLRKYGFTTSGGAQFNQKC